MRSGFIHLNYGSFWSIGVAGYAWSKLCESGINAWDLFLAELDVNPLHYDWRYHAFLVRLIGFMGWFMLYCCQVCEKRFL